MALQRIMHIGGRSSSLMLASLISSGIFAQGKTTEQTGEEFEPEPIMFTARTPYDFDMPRTAYGGSRKASHHNSKQRMPEKKFKAKKRTEKRSRKINRR